jgi:ketosteroid isomerase-like protein
MTDTANVAVVRRLYEARGAPDVLRKVLAPNVRWEVVPGFPYSEDYLGLDAMLGDFFGRLFSDFDEWVTEPTEIFEAGDHVFAVGTYSARARATGKRFTARFAHLWTLEGGRIVRLQQCADTLQLARALAADQ